MFFSKVICNMQHTVAFNPTIATRDDNHTHVNEGAFVIGLTRVKQLTEDYENTGTELSL